MVFDSTVQAEEMDDSDLVVIGAGAGGTQELNNPEKILVKRMCHEHR